MSNALNMADLGMDFLKRIAGPGARRGYVLRIYKNELENITGSDRWKHDLKTAWLTGEDADPTTEAFTNPTLYIKFKPGSLWIAEIHQQRYRLKRKINKRIEYEFLNEVRIK